MNERIRELLEQAGVKYVTMPKDTVYEKFAELIVKECGEIADRYADEHLRLLPSEEMKKKFVL